MPPRTARNTGRRPRVRIRCPACGSTGKAAKPSTRNSRRPPDMDMLIADRGAGEPISLGGALLAGKKVAPDVTGLLMEDHRTVLGWFDWYAEESSPEQKGLILSSILKALV